MKHYKLFGAGIIIAAFVITFFSCQKDELIQVPEKGNASDQLIIMDVYANEGVLVFKNWDVVYSTLETLEKNDEAFKSSWENELGFVSLRSKFDEYVDAETAFFDNLEKEYDGKETELAEEVFLEKFKPIVKQFSDAISLVTFEDGSKFYDMNIYHDNYAFIVNENGIMAVDGIIYRYTKNDERLITDGDWSKLAELMKDNSTEIEYISYNQNLNKVMDPDPGDPCDYTSGSVRTSNHWEQFFPDQDGKLKTLIYYKFWQRRYWYYDADCDYHTYTKTNISYTVRSLKWTWIGIFGWRNFKANINVLYEYSGPNLASNLDGQSKYDHTLTKTPYSSKTYSNHPDANYTDIWTEVDGNILGKNESRITVLNGYGITNEDPGGLPGW